MKVIEQWIFYEGTGWYQLFKLEGGRYKWARTFQHLTRPDRIFVMPIKEEEAIEILKNINQ